MTLTIEPAYDLMITNGSTTLGLLLAHGPDGRKLWTKSLAPGLAPVVQAGGAISYASLPANQEVVAELSDFSRGFGAYDHEPGFYQYADTWTAPTRAWRCPAPSSRPRPKTRPGRSTALS
jgi:hypothetical protein